MYNRDGECGHRVWESDKVGLGYGEGGKRIWGYDKNGQGYWEKVIFEDVD